MRFELGSFGLQVQHSNRSATPPPKPTKGKFAVTCSPVMITYLGCFSVKCCHRLPPFSILRDYGGFSSGENCVLAAVNYIIYGASTNFSCRSCKLAIKISVIVHNAYCVKQVKCSLSYTTDYTGTCPKSPLIFWPICRSTIADHD